MGNKKKKKNVNYTIITIPDRPDVKVVQKRTSSHAIKAKKVLGGILAFCVAAIVLGAGLFVYRTNQKSEEQNEELAQLKETITEDEATIKTLTNKVAVLSGTVDQMTEAEAKRVVEEATKCVPTSIPIGGASGYKEDFDASTSAPIILFEASEGVDVLATARGTVSYVGSDDEYLNVIKVDHGNGYVSVYRNNSQPKVMEGAEVISGSILYIMGPDATVLGYQIMLDGEYIDPSDLMQVFG